MPAIDVTTNIGCVVACRYCPQAILTRNYRQRSNVRLMQLTAFEKCISTIPPSTNICFAGMSEPFLNPSCTKMVRYAHNKGHRIDVSTTLTGMSVRDVELLGGLSFGSFRVHLPSINKHENIVITDDYLRVLERIRNSKIPVTFHFHGTAVAPRVFEVIGKAVARVPTTSRSRNDVIVKDRAIPARKRGPIRCNSGLRFNELLPNGDVFLCCQDFGLEYRLGNLLQSSYESLHESASFLALQKELAEQESDTLCRTCQFSTHLNPTRRLLCSLRYYLEELAASQSTPETIRLLQTIAKRIGMHAMRRS